MNDSSLDLLIKEALGQIDQSPPTWTPPPFDSLDPDGGIDDLVYSSLTEWSPEASEGNWDAFMDLHADEIEADHPVDHIVDTQLTHSEPKFTATSWDEFQQTLNLQSRRNRAVFIGKSIELLLLVLLLWTGSNSGLFTESPLAETKDELKSPIDRSSAKLESSSENLEAASKTGVHQKEAKSLFLKADDKNGRPENEKRAGIGEKTKVKLAASESSVSNAKSSSSGSPAMIFSEAKDNLARDKFQAEKSVLKTKTKLSRRKNMISQLQGKEMNAPLYAEGPQSVVDPLQSISIPKTFTYIAPLPLAKVESLNTVAFDLSFSDVLTNKSYSSPLLSDNKQQSIGLVWGWQLNRIQTAEDPIYPIPQNTQIDQNLFVGLEWEERSGDNAFGLSAGYQQWSYLAPQYAEIYQGQGISELKFVRLDDLKFEIINFGVFARKYIYSSSRWEAFLHFGGGFRLALNSDYRISSGDISAIDISRDDLTPEQIARFPDQPKLWNKNFQEGLLEGGSINENSFMTINIGGGVIHHLSDRWFLQFSPILNLSPFSDGLGPNRDKIQSLSLQIQFRRVLE